MEIAIHFSVKYDLEYETHTFDLGNEKIGKITNIYIDYTLQGHFENTMNLLPRNLSMIHIVYLGSIFLCRFKIYQRNKNTLRKFTHTLVVNGP